MALAFAVGVIPPGASTRAGAAPRGPSPRTVEVVTVPSLAGVQFVLDGVTSRTGPNGRAVLPDTNLKGAVDNVKVPDQDLGGGLRISLYRVGIDPNHGEFQRRLLLELDEDRAITMTFTTQTGLAISPSDVRSVVMVNSQGQQFRFDGIQLRQPVWLPVSRPAQDPQGIQGRAVSYTVSSVMVHGNNIVNTGQQRFVPTQTTQWVITGLFFDLVIQGDELLTGDPIGQAVELTFPDKTVRTVRFGRGHRVTVRNLPRGDYQVRVTGGLMKLTSSVHLSRIQTVTQAVITVRDVIMIGALGFVILSGLLLAGTIGRRRRRDDRLAQTEEVLLAA
ncbi:MAG TPA: hypothetical protein VF942_12880 [Acidimicrobiales bacterium]